MALCLSSANSSLFAPLQLRNSKVVPIHRQSFFCSCSFQSSNDSSSDGSKLVHILKQTHKHLVKLALATAVTGFVVFSPTGDALAAKSGGRVGGQAFRSAPPPSAGPRVGGPSRRTNIYINPPSYGAPPLFGGYGYGGWGWSPFSFFAPGPSIAVGVGGGFSFFQFLILSSIFVGVFNFFRRKGDDDGDDFYDD
ncbi:hypothetical protein GOP47_0028603 [Adiantum capillus-veneris]|nr:hypothetical protein GOP47_0028603 [Adiantum capillus-veneris]